MKQLAKILSFALVATLVVSLAACAAKPQQTSAMYIEKTQLTKQENGIANLLGVGNDQTIYDFALDESVKSMEISAYMLENGGWKPVSEMNRAFSDSKGRLALGFDNLAEGLRTAVQSDNENGSTTYTPKLELNFEGMARATALLDERMEIVYEQEIPLVIQVSTTQNEIQTYDVDSFFTPEKYATHGYERVYAITAVFSAAPLTDE